MVRLLLFMLALLLGVTSTACKEQRAIGPGSSATHDARQEERTTTIAAPLPAEHRKTPTTVTPELISMYPSLDQAFTEILKSKPVIIGIGEFHQKKETTRIPSAVKRFTAMLGGRLGRMASDLIVETWLTEGKCGEQEREVTRKVETATQRPAATEDEVVSLLKTAKRAGVQPHILQVTCAEYTTLLAAQGVDYEQLLTLITRHLEQKAIRVLASRQQKRSSAAGQNKKPGSAPKAAGRSPLLLVYGGALHNDRYPYAELEKFSYAKSLQRATTGRYIEVDLYVPEFIAGDETLSQEPWYPLFRKHTSARRVLLIRRGEGSYIVILTSRRTGGGKR